MSAIPNEQRRNYIVKVTTAGVVYRWTPSRARTRDGRIGIVASGQFYEKANISVPQIELSVESSKQNEVTLTIGTADQAKDELVFDYAALDAPVAISRLTFNEDWSIASIEPWFTGRISMTELEGDTLSLTCYAESGRRRGSGARRSQSKLTTHATVGRGAKLTIFDIR